MPAGPDEPDVVWAGTEPSALFRSDDGGRSFELVRSLWDHPHRPQWEAGFGGQAMHTVLPHPRDPARLLVAMSTGGVYRSEDGGASLGAGQHRHQAYFMPDEWPEFGQCVHKVARDAGNPERLYAQNHHGVYRSDDDGRTWSSIADGLPTDFGFPMVAHPRRGGVVWTFPLVADGERFPPDHRCRVFRSEDAGEVGAAVGRAARGAVLPGGAARRDVRRRRRPRRGLLRHPLRRGLRQPRRGRLLVAGRRAPARRALRPRRGGLSVVTVLLPGPLRGEAGGASRLSVDRRRARCGRSSTSWPSRMPRLARRIRDERGELRRYVNVYVDGEDCRHSGGLATPVGDGAEVQVLPSVAGG